MWYVVAESVQGAAHKRAGKPNQDAVNIRFTGGAGTIVVAAVADGHGSHRSFRSEIGSRLAVDAAVEHFAQRAKELGTDVSLTAIRRFAQEQWPRDILHIWRSAVKDDWDKMPRDDAELEILQAAGRMPPEECDFAIYGTTLLACVVTPRYIAFLQLGDGDIVILSNDGTASRPLVRDERLIGNETTSLANSKVEDWRTGFLALNPEAPAPPQLILLSTDGYANSFRDDTGFLQVASDLAALLRSHGRKYVERELPGWLEQASAEGSGDDVTLCVIGTCQAELS